MGEKDVIVLNSHGVGQYAYAERMPEWGESLRVTNWHIDQCGGCPWTSGFEYSLYRQGGK